MVLLHELAHVRRWDNLVNFAQRLVESLLFFHPAATPPRPLFFTLEQQRMADLAYKALGIELEPLSEEQDKQVTSKTWKGGVCVAATTALGGFQVGDILIGLHVWPTQSLEDVAKVLQREDITELSPLKFYVIRPGGVDGIWSTKPSENLVTGRVPVNLESVQKVRMQNRGILQTPAIPSRNSSRYGQSQPQPRSQPSDPRAPVPLQAYAVPAPISALLPTRVPTLHYDGKTFDQWKEMWKTELKVEKRTECVNALAAFARAGHAKEAAETILDVAGEYDFSTIESNHPEGKLKQRILDIFSTKIPASTWLTPLLNRHDTDEKKWGKLTRWLLSNQYRIENSTRQQLLEIANSDHSLRKTATQVLIKTDRSLQHPETVGLARKALQGKHPDTAVLLTLGYRHLDKVPEQFDLLFHNDRKVRHAARSAFPSRIPQAVERKLLNVLYDPDQSEKHLFAIRAISYSNNYPNPDPLEALLLRIAREGDKQLLGAALFGLTKVMNASDAAVLEKVGQGDLDEDRKKLVSEDGLTILLQEKYFMTRGWLTGGGSGVQGGGGGGGSF